MGAQAQKRRVDSLVQKPICCPMDFYKIEKKTARIPSFSKWHFQRFRIEKVLKADPEFFTIR